MLDKLFWQETDSSASQKLVSIVQETVSISITYSEDQQGVRTILKISSHYAKHVTDGFTNIQPSRERVDGSLHATV
jgi:hypothetical protein